MRFRKTEKNSGCQMGARPEKQLSDLSQKAQITSDRHAFSSHLRSSYLLVLPERSQRGEDFIVALTFFNSRQYELELSVVGLTTNIFASLRSIIG